LRNFGPRNIFASPPKLGAKSPPMAMTTTLLKSVQYIGVHNNTKKRWTYCSLTFWVSSELLNRMEKLHMGGTVACKATSTSRETRRNSINLVVTVLLELHHVVE